MELLQASVKLKLGAEQEALVAVSKLRITRKLLVVDTKDFGVYN